MCNITAQCSCGQWICKPSFKLLIKRIVEKSSFEFRCCGDGNYISQTKQGDGNSVSRRGYFSVVILIYAYQTAWITRDLGKPAEFCLLFSKTEHKQKYLKMGILLLFVTMLILCNLLIVWCQLCVYRQNLDYFAHWQLRCCLCRLSTIAGSVKGGPLDIPP